MPTNIEEINTEIACAHIDALTGKLNTACMACEQLINLLEKLDCKLANFGNAKLSKLMRAGGNAKHEHN